MEKEEKNFANRIEEILKRVQDTKIFSNEDLEFFLKEYSSKSGVFSKLTEEFKSLEKEDKKILGKDINNLKQEIEKVIERTKTIKGGKNSERTIRLDRTKPGILQNIGSRHPVSIVMKEVTDIFKELGFNISYGPEIEDDWHNFSALNFPANHPAREMQDTFFIDKDFALRTHTSSVQVRMMEKEKPPIRTISPGRVYRNEAISARSHCFFHQVEGLCIAEKLSFADLKQTLFTFVRRFFGDNTKVRFRPSYFPFTEPSAEMDVFLGTKTEEDYRITKGTGWLEILGCGMVDPQVLMNTQIDPEKYNGFAFGLGIDRIAMYKFGITDIRDLSENDLRFLRQFATY